MSDREQREEIKRWVTPDDFSYVLSYYGIRRNGKSLVCPFHNDKDFGNCFIGKSGKSAFCYNCGTSFDAIKLVMHFEGLSYPAAVEHLWCNILGHQLSNRSGKKRLLSGADLKFIGLGLYSADAKSIAYKNLAYREETIPQGWIYDHAGENEDRYAPVGIPCGYKSIYELMDSEPEAAIWMILGKAKETVAYYADILNQTDKRKGSVGSLCRNVPKEEYLAFRSNIVESMKRAKKIVAKLAKYQQRQERKQAV